MSSIVRPHADSVNFSKIPQLMTKPPQWVTWKLVKQDGKKKKVPYNPRTGRPAKPNDSSTWGTLQEAIRADEKGRHSGIGFMFASGFAGVDLDQCRDKETGEIEEWAVEIVKGFNSYTEVSPSGCGLHIFIKGKLPGLGINKRNWNGHKIEIYDTGRFFTFTGDHLEGTPLEVWERQAEIESLYKRVDQDTVGGVKTRCKTKSLPMTDEEAMEIVFNAKNGSKFERLWDGDSTGYPSRSEADLAFVRILSFYTQNVEQLERLWKASPRYRSKLERDDYVADTIEKALSSQKDFYRPPIRSRHSGGGYFEVKSSKTKVEDYDPPISEDPEREAYLRRMLANSSKMTRARMMIVAALGFEKLPWRLLNAIHAHQRNKLGVRIITDEKLQEVYRKSGDSKAERTIRRDKKRLWEAQENLGVELVGYWHGRQNKQTGKNYGSKYTSNLDRWALMAIDLAITKNGNNYQIRDEQLKAACDVIAASIVRQPSKKEKRTGGMDMVPEIITLEKQIQRVGKQYRKLIQELKNKMADAGYQGSEIYYRVEEINATLKMPTEGSSQVN
jgi:putative DNA primase/helicase